jgi:group I intron endonuclease
MIEHKVINVGSESISYLSTSMEDISGVYFIINSKSGKFYIGSSKNCRKRKNNHLAYLRNNKHACKYLQYAFNKEGENLFKFFCIEKTDRLEEREQFFLDLFRDSNLLYNSLKSAYRVTGEQHPMFGKTHTIEARAKIKQARERQIIKHSKETRAKIGMGNVDKHLSQETIAKISRTKKLQKLSPWNKGLTAQTDKRLERVSLNSSKKLDDEALITTLYIEGQSISEISQKLNHGWNQIRKSLVRNGIKIRSISEQRKLWFLLRGDKHEKRD